MKNRGVTLLELLLSFFIIAVSATMLAYAFSAFRESNDLGTAHAIIIGLLKDARSRAIASDGNSVYGVHFETGQFVFFEGTSYSVGDPDNVVHELDPQVEITGITLTGGGSEAFFVNHKGTTAQDGTIVFTSETGTRTITVNAAGLIDVD